MNEKIINMGLSIGKDIRTRARIKEISTLMRADGIYVLDFSLVDFISRSFADEIINLMEDSNGRISITGANNEVGRMIAIVKDGRNSMDYKKESRGVKVLRNLKEIESFFSCL